MKKAEIKNYLDQNNNNKILLQILVSNIVNKVIKYSNTNNSEFILNYNQQYDDSRNFINDIMSVLPSFSNNIDNMNKLNLMFYLAALPAKDRVTLRQVEFENCPAKFSIAFPQQTGQEYPQWQHAWGLSGGRGLTVEDSIIGALGEAAECMSVWSRGDEENFIVPPTRIPDLSKAISVASLMNLSGRQIRHLRERYGAISEPHFPLELHFDDFSNRFMQYQDKNANSVHYIPSLCALVGEEPYFGIAGERLTSTNGTAIAENISIAGDKAMFELIERDAVSIWWYNRIERERLPNALVQAACGTDLSAWLADRERRYHVLDLSSDLGVPVAGALSFEADGSMVADGYAAGRTWPEAVLSAVLEMLQAEISLSFMEQKAARDSGAGSAAEASSFYEQTKRMNLFTEKFMAGRKTARSAATFDAEVTAKDALARLTQKNIQIYIADITRPEIGVPTARAVSPQLRDWQPRFGPGRLFDVPVEMGWLDEANTEATLNPRAFLS